MKVNASTAKRIAEYLLDINAIKLDLNKPFTWASGWKSPIYCDNRLSLSFPEIREYVTSCLSEQIKENFDNTEVIAGVATAGIPQGVLVAEKLGLPFIYIRSKPKGHGLTNLIEGRLIPGARVTVIEDLVSTGGSSISAAEAVRAAGMDVLGLVAIFTYGFEQSRNNFVEKNIPFYALSDYEALLDVALQKQYIRTEELERLKAWRQDPAGWLQH